MLKLSSLTLLLLLVHKTSGFISASSSSVLNNIPSTTKLAVSSISQELEEAWSNAAVLGEDAAERTTSLIEERAIDCKSQVMKRIKEQQKEGRDDTIISEDSIEKAAAEYYDIMEVELKRYDRNYRNSVEEAEKIFINTIKKQEHLLKIEIEQIGYEYNLALTASQTTQNGLTEDDIFTAKEYFIQRSAIVDEVFQSAIERAELTYSVSVFEATENRNEEQLYFQNFGRYMPDIMDYNSAGFGNLIAF